MISRSQAIFLVAAISLAAMNLVSVEVEIIRFFATSQLPETTLFQIFFWFWVSTCTAAAAAGLFGGYVAIRTRSLDGRYLLHVFVISLCCVVKVDGITLRWSALSLAFTLGVDRLSLGLNVLGVAAVAWLFKIDTQASVTDTTPSGLGNRTTWEQSHSESPGTHEV